MSFYTLVELLQRHKHDFEDFDIRDIKYQTPIQAIFNYPEIQKILEHPERSEQFRKMCFIVKYQKPQTIEILTNFLECLSVDYDWLAHKMNHTIQQTLSDGDKAIEEYRSALVASDIPRTGDLFVYRLNFLWDIQNKVRQLKRKEYLIIHSRIGFGKKFLAKDACSDYSIFETMMNKVYWINLDNCISDEQIYEKLVKFQIMLAKVDDDIDMKLPSIEVERVEHKIENLKRYLIRLLETPAYKETLLILTGINNTKAFFAFDLQCKLLITTRNMTIFDDIPTGRKTEINVNEGFKQDECMELFVKGTRGKVPRLDFPSTVFDIIKSTYGHPFTIARIAKSFYEYDVRLIHKEMVARQLQDNLDNIGNYTLEEDGCTETVAASYERLETNLQKLYKSLLVFKDDAIIPCKTLELYWGKTEVEVSKIVTKLYKNGLLERNVVRTFDRKPKGMTTIERNLGTGIQTINLHFVYYSFLKSRSNPNEICEMNQCLMKAYRIEAVAKGELPQLADDYYFYVYVGYHLEEAKMEKLFPALYFNLEFLEAKMRATGLSNTIGDLDMYKDHIIANGFSVELLNNLIDFLPTVEEVLLLSPNTCLLQYAFTSDIHEIHSLAKQQLSEDRVWFKDTDHSHKHRQIVPLGKHTPIGVKFLNHPDAALLALQDNSILLKDLSTSYAVENTIYRSHKSPIKTLIVLDNDAFISLDTGGGLSLWSLRNTPVNKRLSSNSRRNSEINQQPYLLSAKQLAFNETSSYSEGTIKQTFNALCQCVSLAKLDGKPLIIAADTAGNIFFIEYDPKEPRMCAKKGVNIKTRNATKGIHSLLMFSYKQGTYIAVLSLDGLLTFYNAINTGEMSQENEWIPEKSSPVNFHQYTTKDESHYLLCVFKCVVLKVHVEISSTRVHTTAIKLYECPLDNWINCSVLSDDAECPYLILGTDYGIKIINVQENMTLPCKNLNDQIAAIDIYSLNDDFGYRHLVISCAKRSGNWIALQATVAKGNGLGWANDRAINDSPIHVEDLSDRSQMNLSLLGMNKFATKTCYDDEISIIIPDKKGRVQIRNSRTHFRPAICTDAFDLAITAIASTKNGYYVGCSSGSVYEVVDDVQKKVTDLSDPVCYLRHCKNGMLLIGTSKYYIVHGIEEKFPGKIGECLEVGNGVVVITTNCIIDIFDAKTHQHTNVDLLGENFAAAATASIRDGPNTKRIIMIGTTNNHVYSYILPFSSIKNSYSDHNTGLLLHNVMISSLAISPDASTWAIGFTNGNIMIYQMNNADPQTSRYVQKLQLNHEQIQDLLFSPWTDPNAPLILVSLSKEIAFWDIKYMINNPYADRLTSTKQHSQRFKKRSQFSPVHPSKDDLQFPSEPEMKYLWHDKKGPSDHPELFACIRLIGKAEKIIASPDFTQFVTLDNEGEIYHLKLYDSHLANGVIS